MEVQLHDSKDFRRCALKWIPQNIVSQILDPSQRWMAVSGFNHLDLTSKEKSSSHSVPLTPSLLSKAITATVPNRSSTLLS